jgi:YD repeat-containing protein
VDTQYDGMGRVSMVSNPYTASATDWTTTSYDTLGRVQSVTRPGSSVVAVVYGVSTSGPAGLSTKVTEGGKSRTTYTDGLGRLIQVKEDPDGLNYQTTYSYNGMDRLVGVAQGAQARWFSYDLVGRLTSSANPESGTIGYGYDANGNLTGKTDGRTSPTTTVTTAYDALNRPITRSYASTLAIDGREEREFVQIVPGAYSGL